MVTSRCCLSRSAAIRMCLGVRSAMLTIPLLSEFSMLSAGSGGRSKLRDAVSAVVVRRRSSSDNSWGVETEEGAGRGVSKRLIDAESWPERLISTEPLPMRANHRPLRRCMRIVARILRSWPMKTTAPWPDVRSPHWIHLRRRCSDSLTCRSGLITEPLAFGL